MLDSILQDVRGHIGSERKAMMALRELTDKSTTAEVCFGTPFL